MSELSNVPLFRGVSLNGLGAIAQAGELCAFAPGEVLMRQGDPSDSLYVIVKGQVRVERSHPEMRQPIHVADLGVGTSVGVMGVLDGAPRTATVTAVEPTEALRLPAAVLAQVLRRYPETTTTLLHILSLRLRGADDLVAETLHRQLLVVENQK